MLSLTLMPDERQSFDNRLARLQEEFRSSLDREQAEAAYDLKRRNIYVASGAVSVRYQIKRVVGMERLKIQAMEETMRVRGKTWNIALATDLRKNILACLAEAEGPIKRRLQDSTALSHGDKLRLMRQWDKERGKLVLDLNILVADAGIMPAIDSGTSVTQPFVDDFDFYTCFISFTEADDVFSESLYNDLRGAGVRCWRWKEDAKWGKTLFRSVDDAVQVYDKLIVICTENSLKAPAVLREIERALQKEDDLCREGKEAEVLFPIRLDDFIFNGWEHERKADVRKKYVGDFRNWNDPTSYKRALDHLVRDLRAEKSPKDEG